MVSVLVHVLALFSHTSTCVDACATLSLKKLSPLPDCHIAARGSVVVVVLDDIAPLPSEVSVTRPTVTVVSVSHGLMLPSASLL